MKYFKLIACCCLLVVSCTSEEAIPVMADFEVTVVNEDYSVPVQVKIENKTSGADRYEWTFDGAANDPAGTSRNPGTIVYENEGVYTIKLFASNQDGEEDSKEVSLEIFSAVTTDFEASTVDNDFSPVEVNIINHSTGATFYNWQFEGGQPEYSDVKDPGNIIFSEPGEHLITLISGNDFEEFSQTKTITVAPYLVSDFEWEVDFQDNDYQAPVTLTMFNKSVSATGYSWTFVNGLPAVSQEENPVVTFETAGTHSITLAASNGKENKVVTKTFEVYPDTNLRIFNDVSLGINSAHNANLIGAYFSTATGNTYSGDETNEATGPNIDLVFFGLDDTFGYNKFVSPDEVTLETTFEPVPGAGHTKFINSLEQCGCGASMSVSEFDAMQDDSVLRSMTIEETNAGSQHFDNVVVPRIVLFETGDGRKGAVKIKEYQPEGTASFIIVDIKVQKEPKL